MDDDTVLFEVSFEVIITESRETIPCSDGKIGELVFFGGIEEALESASFLVESAGVVLYDFVSRWVCVLELLDLRLFDFF